MSQANLSVAHAAVLKQFEAACNALRDAGFSVVAVAAHYGEDARFSTRLTLQPDEQLDLTEDHIVLDAIREIMIEWHAANHGTDLVPLFRPT